ncbi:LysR family transcriptional regulator [Pseudoalteromonas rubra]|uniref:LysR family transcriptional regulator n=1 Tax=Pseudoalteromonas rubra TaxID=43658 RepID=A0A5S3WIH0_9GAMM|nr:LysR family transcriptional regulator [Pseudoalteromonas rubra]TMP27046.1 LysR family transcriptional regulator [Pseudoalteromonas rubra]TMP36189.1 LysR family transcriptional regulator [Pseudoalteromonas rubra]
MALHVSLQALRAFEAAARHSSFKHAAEELALTPTAISHHISKLEDRLNVSLFIRQTRKIVLTDAGRLLATATTEGFTQIETALASIRQLNEVVRVTTTSSFAAQVLLPELYMFNQHYPDIVVQIASGELMDSQPHTIPIRLGNIKEVQAGDRLNVEHYNLFGHQSLESLRTSDTRPVIYSTRWKNPALCKPPLEAWLAENGLNKADFKIREFDQELFCVQQAVAEQAWVFCSETLTRRLCAMGQLRPISSTGIASELCYYIPGKTRSQTDNAKKFIAWVQELILS